MKMLLIQLIIFLLVSVWCCCADYKAAVVEYDPSERSTPDLTIEENIVNYVKIIEKLKQSGTQIVVFPEYGLTGLVQDPKNYSILVPDVYTSEFSNVYLLRLSNVAKENEIFVVVNLLEKVIDASNKTIYYNTNVVFADNGTLIAKYRKINLFYEPQLTSGHELVTFKTNFGTFGLMTCMDILYYYPSQALLTNTGVTDVIFIAAWNSFLPFYMSLEVSAGYVLANKVNLLASNLNDPSTGKGGSAIYNKDGTVLSRVLTDKHATNTLLANVASNPNTNDFILSGFDIFNDETRQELSNYKNLRDFQQKSYKFKTINLSGENTVENICHGSFCCNFNITSSINSSEIYMLMAYKGATKFESKTAQVQFCYLIACTTKDLNTCGERPATPYSSKFQKISVWGTFKKDGITFFRPASLRGNLLPVDNVTYIQNSSNSSFSITFNTTRTFDNVVLFGLYGRSNAGIPSISLIFIAVLAILQVLF